MCEKSHTIVCLQMFAIFHTCVGKATDMLISSWAISVILLRRNYLEWKEENVTENKTKLRKHRRNRTDNHDGWWLMPQKGSLKTVDKRNRLSRIFSSPSWVCSRGRYVAWLQKRMPGHFGQNTSPRALRGETHCFLVFQIRQCLPNHEASL